MNEKYGILWDLDGTLIDTKESHVRAWGSIFKKRGFHLDTKILDLNFGRTNEVIVPLLLGFIPDDKLLTSIINEKEEEYRRIAPSQSSLIPGVETWLITADTHNIKQAIASSSPIANIDLMLNSFKIDRYFGAIISGTTLPAKPEPDIFIKAAEEIGCKTENCLVIEDSVAGVEGAKNAGMKCLAVATSHTEKELSLADRIVKDFTGSFFDFFSSLNWN